MLYEFKLPKWIKHDFCRSVSEFLVSNCGFTKNQLDNGCFTDQIYITIPNEENKSILIKLSTKKITR